MRLRNAETQPPAKTQSDASLLPQAWRQTAGTQGRCYRNAGPQTNWHFQSPQSPSIIFYRVTVLVLFYL